MKKNEFLSELRKRLSGLPKDDLENRISFYDEMIEDRMDEGKTEEQAVEEIGTVDEVVRQIANETPLATLVKEKTRGRPALKAWQVILIFLGFPVWLPIVLVTAVLGLVGYLIIWVLVLAVYAADLGLAVMSIAGFISFAAYWIDGQFNLTPLGGAIMCVGGSILLVYACIYATKGAGELTKLMLLGIKTAFIGKERKQ